MQFCVTRVILRDLAALVPQIFHSLHKITHFLTGCINSYYVALIIDYSGACRKDEITNISIDDIEIRPDDGIYTKIKKQCVNTICN
jgi:hypothetical protein